MLVSITMSKKMGYSKSKKKSKVVCYRTDDQGSVMVLISIVRQKRRPTNLLFLVDLWKMGIKDLRIRRGSADTLIRELSATLFDDTNFIPISKKEAAHLLAQGLKIANYLHLDLDADVRKWLKKLGVYKVNIEGSVYKCYRCETNDLTPEEEDIISEATLADLNDGTIGEPMESLIYFTCSTCKK